MLSDFATQALASCCNNANKANLAENIKPLKLFPAINSTNNSRKPSTLPPQMNSSPSSPLVDSAKDLIFNYEDC